MYKFDIEKMYSGRTDEGRKSTPQLTLAISSFFSRRAHEIGGGREFLMSINTSPTHEDQTSEKKKPIWRVNAEDLTLRSLINSKLA